MKLDKIKNFKEFLRNNEKQQDTLKKLTEPLERSFGIDVFWHATVHNDGLSSNICNYNDSFCHFWENHWYQSIDFMVSPEHLNEGYFFLDYDNRYNKYTQKTAQKYPIYHPFMIIRKEGNHKANLFGFSSKRYLANLPSLYINNLSILNSYIDYFLKSDSNYKTPSGENMIDLATVRGKDFYYGQRYGEGSLPQKKQNTSFLKQIGVCPNLLKAAENLTKREKEVLLTYLERKTAAQIGEELGLSHRTIQTYIENFKNKLSAFTKEELIASGKILNMAGLL